jgi:hypothetical protein
VFLLGGRACWASCSCLRYACLINFIVGERARTHTKHALLTTKACVERHRRCDDRFNNLHASVDVFNSVVKALQNAIEPVFKALKFADEVGWGVLDRGVLVHFA